MNGMTSADIIHHHLGFQQEKQLSSVDTCLEHIIFDASLGLRDGISEDLLLRVVDITILAHAIFANLCQELGIAPEQIDAIVKEHLQ